MENCSYDCRTCSTLAKKRSAVNLSFVIWKLYWVVKFSTCHYNTDEIVGCGAFRQCVKKTFKHPVQGFQDDCWVVYVQIVIKFHRVSHTLCIKFLHLHFFHLVDVVQIGNLHDPPTFWCSFIHWNITMTGLRFVIMLTSTVSEEIIQPSKYSSAYITLVLGYIVVASQMTVVITTFEECFAAHVT